MAHTKNQQKFLLTADDPSTMSKFGLIGQPDELCEIMQVISVLDQGHTAFESLKALKEAVERSRNAGK